MSDEITLSIDTETTGFKKPGALIQPGQARVCQIAMILSDSSGKSLHEFCALIRPDNWQISEGAQKIHGFSNEICEKYGIAYGSAVLYYRRLARMADVIVAHNEEFDRNMMAIEEAYYNADASEPLQTQKPWFCTMKTNTHITGGKWPKLEETLKHYTGRTLGEYAHDAMYDVKACRDIYFEMQKRKAA